MRAVNVAVAAAVVVFGSACGGCGPAPVPLTIEPSVLPPAALATPYSVTLSVTDGEAPVTFALLEGDLPSGITLTDGVIAGVPLTAATSRFTVRARDATGRTGDAMYELVVAPNAITVAPAQLEGGVRGASYVAQFTASGGTPPYQFSITAGALPAGLLMSTSGTVSGRPTVSGTATFTVRATDSFARVGEVAARLEVVDPMLLIVPQTLSAGSVGLDYEELLDAMGAVAPYSFSLESGTLPPGLTLTPGGVLSGRPTTAGTSTFEVRATDAIGTTATAMRSIEIAAPALSITPESIAAVTVGTPLSVTLAATGGAAPYTFAVTRGTLPPGVTLTAAGVLSGTPTTITTVRVNITATDSASVASTRSFTLESREAVLAVTPSRLPSAQPGAAYSQQLTADGGSAPYLFAVSTGSVPPGMSLSPQGLLSGTPTAAQTANFTVRVSDFYSSSNVFSLRLVVTPVVLEVTPATLPSATAGVPYAQQFGVDGGTPPWTFVLQGGALPAGLSLDAAGLLSGTATAAGTAAFEVMAIDAQGATGQRATQLDVLP